MLLLAFLCVGATVCYITLYSLNRTQERDNAEAVEGYAAFLGGQISSEQHQSALAPTVAGAKRQGTLLGLVQETARHFKAIQSVYSVRKATRSRSGSPYQLGIQFVGQMPQTDSIPPSPFLKRAFETGQPSTRMVEAGGSSMPTAFVPLVGKNGRTGAVLVVEGAPFQNRLLPANWGSAIWMVVGAILLTSFLCTSILARQILANAEKTSWTRGLRAITRAIRNPLLEFILVSATIVTLVSGLQGISRWQDATKELQGIELKVDRLEDLSRVLSRDYAGQSVPRTALIEEASPLGLASLADSFARTRSQTQFEYPSLMKQVRGVISQARTNRDLVKQDQERSELSARVTLWVAGLMILGSIVLIRIAAGQQTELESAEMDSARLQGAYSQVAENLPIGLFAYQGNTLKFTNKVWDQLTSRFPFENRMEALMKAIHPDDAPRFREALAEAEKSRQPMDLQYRLRAQDGTERRIETRAVPILDTDGSLEYMLGFGLDVTDMLEAQQQLELRNKEVSAKNSQLHKALTDIEDNFEAMVHSLVKAVEAKDPYTAGHSERVMGYSVRIGEEMGLSPKDLRILERGALVHDIGKIGVPDALLTKPSALTDEEFAIVKQHPMIGFRMIQGIPIFHECVPIVLWHHERLDGKGYPDRLSGDQIPLLVRITAVADCFDAMTSNRAYRRGMQVDRALNLLREDAVNGALDPEIVEVLVKVVNRDGLLWQATEIPAA